MSSWIPTGDVLVNSHSQTICSLKQFLTFHGIKLHLTECPHMRQTLSERQYLGFWRDLAGLTHPWIGLTSQNSFGLGSTLRAWEPRPKFRHTNKINILSCCSNFKILLNLSLWVCLKKFGSKKFFEPPTGHSNLTSFKNPKSFYCVFE